MKMNHAKWTALTLIMSAAPVMASPKVMMNGKVASADVRVVGGGAYVKLSDIAKALGLVVVKRGEIYELKKPGGTHQVGNMSGSVGDVLFDGKWRFQVLDVQKVDEHTIEAPAIEPISTAWDLLQWNRETRVIRAAQGYQLVEFRCRVTNGQKTKQTLWTSPYDQGIHTALADQDGGAHIPALYDYPGAAAQTKPLLPGQSLNFALVFSVPEKTRLKDLIFSLKNNDYAAQPNDVRVSVSQMK